MSGSMDGACLHEHDGELLICLHVTPNARRTEPVGERVDRRGRVRLALKLRARPVEGQANRAAAAWVAETLGVAPSLVRLARGERSREKDFAVSGIGREEAISRLIRSMPEAREAPPRPPEG